MKNILILFVLCFFFASCRDKNISGNENKEASLENPFNPIGVNSDQLVPGSYLFYLDEDYFIPVLMDKSYDILDKESKEALLIERKNEIVQYFSDSVGYNVEPEDVYALSFSAVKIEGISEDDALKIIEFKFVLAGQNDFTIQNIRPRMQAQGPMNQNIRPKMQEEWQYDSVKHTSTNIEFVNPSGAPGSLDNKIWIVDTGVDGDHQDLNVVADLSRSFVDNETNPLIDILGHGTHCAGIAAGKAHHESDSQLLGMNGVSPGAPIVSIKIIDWNGDGLWSKVLDAMEYIISEANPGDIISLSIGDKLPGFPNPNKCKPMPNTDGNPNNKRYLLNQIEQLANMGVFVVMAAGNTDHSSSEGFFPGCYDYPTHVVTIASIKTSYNFSTNTYTSTFSTFSSIGMPSIDFVAPGEMMFSTFPDNRYAVLSGTSMSTAVVTGIIHARGGMPVTSGTVNGPPSSTDYPVAKVQ